MKPLGPLYVRAWRQIASGTAGGLAAVAVSGATHEVAPGVTAANAVAIDDDAGADGDAESVVSGANTVVEPTP